MGEKGAVNAWCGLSGGHNTFFLFPTGYITVYPKVLFFVLKVSTNTGASIDFLLAHALPSVPKWRLEHLRFGR